MENSTESAGRARGAMTDRKKWRTLLLPLASFVAYMLLVERLSAVDRQSVRALLLVVSGLGFLFPLAAFGAQTQRGAASRVRTAIVGVVAITVGLAQVIPDARLRTAIYV